MHGQQNIKYSSSVEYRHIQHSVTTVPLNIKNQIHKASQTHITETQNKMLEELGKINLGRLKKKKNSQGATTIQTHNPTKFNHNLDKTCQDTI